MVETTNNEDVEINITPVDLPPAIANLLAQAESEIAEESERQEAERLRDEAKMNAFLTRQTALLLDQLSGIPATIRPYIKAADKPLLDVHQTDDWFPNALLVEVPGFNPFYFRVIWPPFNDEAGPTVSGFYYIDYYVHHNYRNWNEAIVESRRKFLWQVNRSNERLAEPVRRREADERQPTTAERLVALIEEITTRKVAELLEV